jgi:Tfp pilus assembly protein PilW
MLTVRTIPHRARDAHGFTLVELLVAMSTGTVVMLALVAILEFSGRQAARINDVAQANQLGRTAMAKIVSELDSACIAPSFEPIQKESSETELRFVNAYSEEAVIAESEADVYEHHIVWNKATGKLIDYTYPKASGTWPTFTFSSKESPKGGVLLASGVEQTKSGGKALPIFQYYSYANKASSSNETGLSTLNTEPLITGSETKLNTTTAAEAASVLISFTTAPPESTTILGSTGGDTHIPLSDQVTLAFRAPKSETTTADAPCQ